MVTNQSVEAAPGIAGVPGGTRSGATNGAYSVHQQGTYAPDDGVHRWMGSHRAWTRTATWRSATASSTATNVFPGIRYTGRLAGDPLGQMTAR